MSTYKKRDVLKLHFIIFLWGFTGILGDAIKLDPWHLVFYRTSIAAIFLGIEMIRRKQFLAYPTRAVVEMLSVGFLVGLHWVCFFAAIKMGGVSVGMVGISTMAIFTALLEPLMRNKKLHLSDLFFSGCAMIGLCFIAAYTFDHVTALLVSVLAAALAAIFTHLTVSMIEKDRTPLAITFYQMIGGMIVTFGAVLIVQTQSAWSVKLWPTMQDWVYLLVLGGICTAYAATACNELLKRISAFTCNLSLNMEPVYGILLAAFLLGEHKRLTQGFYFGFFVILAAVIAQFWWSNRSRTKSQSNDSLATTT